MRDGTQSPMYIALDEALREAMRFADRANRAKMVLKSGQEDIARSKSVAAMLRASLDLTDALIKLRKAKRW